LNWRSNGGGGIPSPGVSSGGGSIVLALYSVGRSDPPVLLLELADCGGVPSSATGGGILSGRSSVVMLCAPSRWVEVLLLACLRGCGEIPLPGGSPAGGSTVLVLYALGRFNGLDPDI